MDILKRIQSHISVRGGKYDYRSITISKNENGQMIQSYISVRGAKMNVPIPEPQMARPGRKKNVTSFADYWDVADNYGHDHHDVNEHDNKDDYHDCNHYHHDDSVNL